MLSRPWGVDVCNVVIMAMTSTAGPTPQLIHYFVDSSCTYVAVVYIRIRGRYVESHSSALRSNFEHHHKNEDKSINHVQLNIPDPENIYRPIFCAVGSCLRSTVETPYSRL